MYIFSNYPIWLLSLAVVFFLAWFIQIIIQLTVQRQVLSRCKSERRKVDVTFVDDKPGVSVIVYAHNQAEALLRNLPMLLDNNYPNFEVIVVDDMSCDDTLNVLTIMEQRSENIFHTKITDKVRTMSHRKLAVMLGARAAHNDIIITTQAQCMPVSQDWISCVVRNFTPWTDIVIAPVVFEGRTGIVSRFCQYDLFQRLVMMFGLTMAIRPFAGWGKNLAFRKGILFADGNKAFNSHLNIHPGEDDLFVAQMATRNNVAVECTPEAMMIDQQSPLHVAWSKDRLNRAFTGRQYAFAPMFVKGLDVSTRYLCVLPGLALLAIGIMKLSWIKFAIILALMLIRMSVISSLAYLTSKELGIHRYLLSPIVYELFTPIVDIWFRLKASIRRKQFNVGRLGN